jgi:hypothetical protein
MEQDYTLGATRSNTEIRLRSGQLHTAPIPVAGIGMTFR